LYVDIKVYIAIICNMRFISLFLIFNVALCYSGVCSATLFVAEGTANMGSHCEMANHDADKSDESQVLFQYPSTHDSENTQCCYDVLTNSSTQDNSTYKALDVLYLLDLPTSQQTSSSRSIDLILTKRVHDPPDIYLSVSSFLL